MFKKNKSHHRKRLHFSAFTLVEVIIYVAIAGIFFSGAIGFFWQMKQSQIKSSSAREVQENMAQAMEVFKYYVRNAEDVDTANSTFSSHPGELTLTFSGDDRVIDTYTKLVSIGNETVNVRTLRLTHGLLTYDLTSDYVNVDSLIFNNLTDATEPAVVQMQLTLSYVNAGDLDAFDYQFINQTTANIRYES